MPEPRFRPPTGMKPLPHSHALGATEPDATDEGPISGDPEHLGTSPNVQFVPAPLTVPAPAETSGAIGSEPAPAWPQAEAVPWEAAPEPAEGAWEDAAVPAKGAWEAAPEQLLPPSDDRRSELPFGDSVLGSPGSGRSPEPPLRPPRLVASPADTLQTVVRSNGAGDGDPGYGYGTPGPRNRAGAADLGYGHGTPGLRRSWLMSIHDWLDRLRGRDE